MMEPFIMRTLPCSYFFFYFLIITTIQTKKVESFTTTTTSVKKALTTTTTTTTATFQKRRRRRKHTTIIEEEDSICKLYAATSSEEEEEEEEDSSSLLLETISDEEALLACQAYLRKKRKLPWNQYEQRLHQQKRFVTEDDGDDEGGVGVGYIGGDEGRGYFWDNPLELKYLSRGSSSSGGGGKRRILEEDFEVDDYFQNEEEEDSGEFSKSRVEEEEEEDDDDRNDASEDYSRVLVESYDESPFTSYPLYPPLEHIRRSNAAKKTWSDPKWKAKWYKQRWGSKVSSSSSSSPHSSSAMEKKKRNKIANRVSNIPNDVLMSSELQNLSDEEVQEAIQMYVVANKKRSESHLKRAMERRERRERSLSEDMKILKNNGNDESGEKSNQAPQQQQQQQQQKKNVILSFEIPSGTGGTLEEQMREKQRQRAEVAKRAYQTRLRNQQKQQNKKGEEEEEQTNIKKSTTKRTRDSKKILAATTLLASSNSNTATAKANTSLNKIVQDLNSNILPSTYDVTQILLPGRLSLRRKVLVRVLNDCFDLRGKCVPDYELLEELEEKSGKKEESSEMMMMMMMMEEKVPMQFATHCPIQDLGEFVLHKLSEAKEEEEEKEE